MTEKRVRPQIGNMKTPTDVNNLRRNLTDLFKIHEGIIIVENRTDDPASPKTGQMWFRTDV